MSTTIFLYRRNGTYYFRWHIPLCCRVRMSDNTPDEFRLSLRTTSPINARRIAARLWLASLETVEYFLATSGSIGYHELVEAIKDKAHMSVNTDTVLGTSFISLCEITHTVELVEIKNALAKLKNLGAQFYIPISSCPAAIWQRIEVLEDSLEDEIRERMNDFNDAAAILTSAAIVDALAAQNDLLEIKAVHSNHFDFWCGDAHKKEYFDVLLDTPVLVNISSILVDSCWVNKLPKNQSVRAKHTDGNDFLPLKLSQGCNDWINDHKDSWSSSTTTSYKSYIDQFIEIVGDKLTTNLTPEDFSHFDAIMRRLPKTWVTIRKKTNKTHQTIADEADKLKLPRLDSTSLKERGTRIGVFFDYLKGKGYWHGKYGSTLFTGIKKNTKKIFKHVFTDTELQNIFQGKGIDVFEKAKFALYVWGTVLMLYTGARPSEISQLQRKDIRQDDDQVWYIYINEENDDDEDDSSVGKKLKTASSKRSVPIHPILIELGFMKFINQFKPHEYIFPEYKRHKIKSSRELGKWVNEKLLSATVEKIKKASQYSFRHTVIERFKADATKDHYSCAYTGHSTSDDKKPANKIFADTYGRGHKPKTLADNLHPLLNYKIDWAPLKKVITNLDKNWKGQRSLLEKKQKIAKSTATKAATANAKMKSV